MFQILLFIYAVTNPYLSSAILEPQQQQLLLNKSQELGSEVASIIIKNQEEATLNNIQTILHQEAPTLSSSVIDKILSTIKCANDNHVEHSPPVKSAYGFLIWLQKNYYLIPMYLMDLIQVFYYPIIFQINLIAKQAA